MPAALPPFPAPGDEKTLYFIMENVLSEMLEGFGYLVEAVVPNDKGSSVTVCRKAEGNVQTVDRLKDKGVFERFHSLLSVLSSALFLASVTFSAALPTAAASLS